MKIITKKLHILRVDVVAGSDLKFGWEKDMQVVFTTKGIYISAMPSEKVPDWSEFIDGKKYRVDISEGSGHNWIANPRPDYQGGFNEHR